MFIVVTTCRVSEEGNAKTVPNDTAESGVRRMGLLNDDTKGILGIHGIVS